MSKKSEINGRDQGRLERGDRSYDEGFKALVKELFAEDYQVITDYELIINPKRVDVVVIMGDEPQKKRFYIFNYFKKFNIIEFKSEKEGFSVDRHLAKLLIYLGAFIGSEKGAGWKNTTFTLVSSRKPKKFLKMFDSTTQRVKKGLYYIKGAFPVPLYLVVPGEVDGQLEFNEELALLKEFSGAKDRKVYLREILRKVIKGDERYSSYLAYAFSLYRDEIYEVAQKEGLNMTLIERNLRAVIDDFNLKKIYFQDVREEGMIAGKLEDARKMLEKGLDIELILEITGLPREQVEEQQDGV